MKTFLGKATALSWCAGLFDADGCFSLYWEHNKSSKQFPYLVATATVEIREEFVARVFEKLFGGSVSAKRRRADSHSQTYVWRVSRSTLDHFITKIRPYLVLKADQADVIASARSVRAAKASKPITVEEYVSLSDHKFWMETLNQTGVGKQWAPMLNFKEYL